MKTPSRLVALNLVLLTVLLAACAGSGSNAGEGEPELSGIEVDQKSAAIDEERKLEIEDEFQRLLNEAARLHLREDYRSAANLVAGALALNPPEPLGHRLRALQIEVRRKLLRRSYVDAFVRFDRSWYTIGEIIEGEIVFMNIADRTLVIPAKAVVDLPEEALAEAREGEMTAETRSVIRSVMTYREYLPNNTIITNRRTWNVSIPEDIVLQPGEVHRVPVTIDSGDINVTGTMYRRYRLDCSLHAAEIRVGNEIFHGAVDYRSASVGVFPRNAEHLSAEAFANVRKAFDKQAALHLTLAAAFLDREDEVESFLRFALEELERPEGIERLKDAIMAALAIVMDDENTRSLDEWTAWLKREIGR